LKDEKQQHCRGGVQQNIGQVVPSGIQPIYLAINATDD
jgi:hypothetical protein